MGQVVVVVVVTGHFNAGSLLLLLEVRSEARERSPNQSLRSSAGRLREKSEFSGHQVFVIDDAGCSDVRDH